MIDNWCVPPERNIACQSLTCCSLARRQLTKWSSPALGLSVCLVLAVSTQRVVSWLYSCSRLVRQRPQERRLMTRILMTTTTAWLLSDYWPRICSHPDCSTLSTLSGRNAGHSTTLHPAPSVLLNTKQGWGRKSMRRNPSNAEFSWWLSGGLEVWSVPQTELWCRWEGRRQCVVWRAGDHRQPADCLAGTNQLSILTCVVSWPVPPLTLPPDNNLSLIRNSQPRRTKHKNVTDMGPQTSDPVSHIIRKILRIFQDNSTFRKIWEILSWNTDWLSVTWNNFILVISASASRSTEWGRVSRWNKEREI